MDKNHRSISKVIVFIAVLALISMTFCCFTSCTDKEPKILVNFESADFSCALYDNGEVFITSYNGGETGNKVVKVTVPAKVVYQDVEYAVKGVSSLAFDHSKVSEVELEEGIERVDSYAFSYCSATIITLPSTITSIGEYAFVNTLSLRRLIVKAEVPPTLGKNSIKYYDTSLLEYRVSDILKITVPKDSYDSYLTEWRDYADALNK